MRGVKDSCGREKKNNRGLDKVSDTRQRDTSAVVYMHTKTRLLAQAVLLQLIRQHVYVHCSNLVTILFKCSRSVITRGYFVSAAQVSH